MLSPWVIGFQSIQFAAKMKIIITDQAKKTDDWTNARGVHVYPSKVKLLKYHLPTQH